MLVMAKRVQYSMRFFVSESVFIIIDSHANLCSAPEKVKAIGQVLSKYKDQLYDCKIVTDKLREMLQSAEKQVRSIKKQSAYLSQYAAKTMPNGIHCLSMRLTIDYHLLPPERQEFPRRRNLEDPDLYHYALFSDNVLAASVVVNSTIANAKVSYWLVTQLLNLLLLFLMKIVSCLFQPKK